MEQKHLENTRKLMNFILQSPSPYHAVATAVKELEAKGFIRLNEKERFNIERGKSYYVTRSSSSLIAFRVPRTFRGFNIVASHSDSPSFKVKMNPEVKSPDSPVRLNVEKYGSPLLSTWFDHPLSVAGRVFIKKDGKAEERLVNLGQRFSVMIPSLAIHQNRDANDGWKISVQKEMLPVFSDDEAVTFMDKLSQSAQCRQEDILDYDLFLYNKTSPSFWGADGEFFSSPKIDDLEGVWASVEAITTKESRDMISMITIFDNEESGSCSRQGALSDFLVSTLDRVLTSLRMTEEEKYMCYASSFVISSDNGHAVHPAWREKGDVTNHPRMNGGVLLKYASSLRYATDAESGAVIRMLMENNNIPYQVFHNHSDVRGGSTLGNLSIQKISIRTADVGAAQLAMHSSYESAGTKDTTAILSLFSAFLSE